MKSAVLYASFAWATLSVAADMDSRLDHLLPATSALFSPTVAEIIPRLRQSLQIDDRTLDGQPADHLINIVRLNALYPIRPNA